MTYKQRAKTLNFIETIIKLLEGCELHHSKEIKTYYNFIYNNITYVIPSELYQPIADILTIHTNQVALIKELINEKEAEAYDIGKAMANIKE